MTLVTNMLNCMKSRALFICLGSTLSTLGCTHRLDPIDPQADLLRLGVPYTTKENESLETRLSYFDLEPSLTKGFIWQPLILPNMGGLSFSESDLLVGYSLSSESFIPSPQSGSCQLLLPREGAPNKNLKAFYFISQNPNPHEDAESLFLILNSLTSKPQAIARLNTKGEAICFLEDKNYTASTQFGQNRNEVVVAGAGKRTPLSFRKKGTLYIHPSKTNALLNGDLIRIGRKGGDELTELENPSELDFSTRQILIPTQIEGDLYQESNFQSAAMGVDEYLKTSFLVGNISYNINLDMGKYIVTVMRKNRVVCREEVDLKPKVKHIVSCADGNDRYEEKFFFEKNVFPYTLDSSIYPQSLEQNPTFLNWLLPTDGTLASALRTEMKNKTEERSFTFLFGSGKEQSILQLPFSFELMKHKLSSPMPILEPEIDNVAKGSVPYTFFTRIVPTQKIDENFLNNSHVQMTNGVLIQVYEPDVFQENIFQNTKEKTFRLHVFIPAWNSTNVIEMIVDGKVDNRFVFNRGDITIPQTITFDLKTFKSPPFSVRFTAWGDSFLPDYLTGDSSLLPYCTTRTYFFK